MTLKSCKPGDVVILQGGKGKNMYVVLSGTVDVRIQNKYNGTSAGTPASQNNKSADPGVTTHNNPVDTAAVTYLKRTRSKHRRRSVRKRNTLVQRATKISNTATNTMNNTSSSTSSTTGNISKYVDHENNVYTWQDIEASLGSAIHVLTTGQAFGELALMNKDTRRTASCVAGKNGCDLIQISRSSYQKVLAKHQIEFRPQQLHGK